MEKTNCGIYKITNVTNNKVYIGSSANLKSRKYTHFHALKNNLHVNKHLQSAVIKYGIENFKFEVMLYLEKLDCKVKLREDLLNYENLELSKYKKEDGSIDQSKCYNSRIYAESNLGIKLYTPSDETKKKQRIAKIGKKLSKTHVNRIQRSRKGYTHSKETKEKIGISNSISLKGKKHSKERSINKSKNQKGSKRSEKARENMKLAQKMNTSLCKGVINLTTGETFKSMKKAAESCGLKCGSRISKVCMGKVKTAGKNIITGERYQWSYAI